MLDKASTIAYNTAKDIMRMREVCCVLYKNWKKDIWSIPNLLSLFRLVLIPVYVSIYLHAETREQYILAGCILAVSCLTDMITQLTLTLCLSLKYPVLYPVLALLVVKELVQLALGVLFLRRGKMLPGALMAGKVCTTVLFVSLITLVLLPGMPGTAVNCIAVIDSVFLAISFISYLHAYFGKEVKVQDIER